MDSLALTTQYTFWISLLCLASGTLYFLTERNSIAPEYRSTATTAAVICFIATANYFMMGQMVGRDGVLESVLNFPTEFRYLDWLITTPLILTKFPTLLGEGEDRKPLLVTLIFADLVMIICGYAGEFSINVGQGKLSPLGISMFIAGSVAWGFIIYLLQTVVTKAAEGKLEPIKVALIRLKKFIIIGWGIYPLGYLVTLFGLGPEAQLIREIVYNIADVVNKVGFGLVAVFAVQQVTREQRLRKAIADL